MPERLRRVLRPSANRKYRRLLNMYHPSPQLHPHSYALFYQHALKRIGNFPAIILSESIDLEALLALSTPTLDSDAVSSAAARVRTHSLLLHDYFGVRITAEGKLSQLPEIVAGHVPNSISLPALIRDLSQVCAVSNTLHCCVEGFR